MSLVVRGGFIVISYTDNKATFPDSRRQSTSVRFNDTGLCRSVSWSRHSFVLAPLFLDQ